MTTFRDLDIWLRIPVAFVYIVIILVLVAIGFALYEYFKSRRRDKNMCNGDLTKQVEKRKDDGKEQPSEEN